MNTTNAQNIPLHIKLANERNNVVDTSVPALRPGDVDVIDPKLWINGNHEQQRFASFALVTRCNSVLTAVDLINRMAAATGSVSYAQRTAHADYNGHSVGVSFNNYRKYWVAEHFWGERVVHARNCPLVQAVAAALEGSGYTRGHKGASVTVNVRTVEELNEVLTAFPGLFLCGAAAREDGRRNSLVPAWMQGPVLWDAMKTHNEHLMLNAEGEEAYWNARHPKHTAT